MNCKDCFHYDICLQWSTEPLNNADWCSNFKDKDRVVELPYKVGDKVYLFYSGGGIREETITDITIVLDRYDPPYLKFDTQTKINGGIYSSFFNGNLIDKKVFRNKEEAERARNNEL